MDHQPRPRVRTKKSARDRLIRLAASHPTWALGFQDEVWWSRLARPQWHSWQPTAAGLRLIEKTLPKRDRTPKALAGDGLLLRATPTTPEQIWLRLAVGQPGSGLTTQYLAWCCDTRAALGPEALWLIWDNASWHDSADVRPWIRTHNHQVKAQRHRNPLCKQHRVIPSRCPNQMHGNLGASLVTTLSSLGRTKNRNVEPPGR